MDGRYRGGVVTAGADARQRFHDARGYGRPIDDGLALAPVEAAHLLYRGDLDAVLVGREDGADRLDFRRFLVAGAPGFFARFLVYKDLRDRGFYLSPAPEPRTDLAVDTDVTPATVGEGIGADRAGRDHDFIVHPRGEGPWDGGVRYRVRAIGEADPVAVETLGGVVLAIVDEEGEITYLETADYDPTGFSGGEMPTVTGQLVEDGVLVWDPPAALHEEGFYGQPFDGRTDGPDGLVLSLVEAASLAARGVLTLRTPDPGEPETGGAAEEALDAIVGAGRAIEGERFDLRLRVYRELRDRGLVPKTGFKFGADFRVYASFEGLEDLGHSELLVRVLSADHVFSPQNLALDVRLAGGVRKRMVFVRSSDDGLDWVAVERLTP